MLAKVNKHRISELILKKIYEIEERGRVLNNSDYFLELQRVLPVEKWVILHGKNLLYKLKAEEFVVI